MSSRKARHNEKIRQRILDAAAVAFREKGYAGANIDRIMDGAGLTRGAFYAHFRSKTALFAEVIETDQPLLTWLRGRSQAAPDMLGSGMRQVFRRYLDPENLPVIARTCALACLCRDASLGSDDVQEAHEQAVRATVAEMARGQGATPEDPTLMAALVLAVGSVSLAAGCRSDDVRRNILNAASEQVQSLLSDLKAEDQPTPGRAFRREAETELS